MSSFLASCTPSSIKHTQSVNASTSTEGQELSILTEEIEKFGQSITIFSGNISTLSVVELRNEKSNLVKSRDEITKKIDVAKRKYRRRSVEYMMLERLERQFTELKQELKGVLENATEAENEKNQKSQMELTFDSLSQENLSNGNSSGENTLLSEQMPFLDVIITDSQLSTIETQRQIAEETNKRLLSLEEDMDELNSCLKDLMEVVRDQQRLFDRIDNNVKTANSSMERGTQDVRSAKGFTITEQVKTGLNNPLKLLKLPGMIMK